MEPEVPPDRRELEGPTPTRRRLRRVGVRQQSASFDCSRPISCFPNMTGCINVRNGVYCVEKLSARNFTAHGCSNRINFRRAEKRCVVTKVVIRRKLLGLLKGRLFQQNSVVSCHRSCVRMPPNAAAHFPTPNACLTSIRMIRQMLDHVSTANEYYARLAKHFNSPQGEFCHPHILKPAEIPTFSRRTPNVGHVTFVTLSAHPQLREGTACGPRPPLPYCCQAKAGRCRKETGPHKTGY